jgi:hypothetical protein
VIIASFPKWSFPEYTWPVGTWPVAGVTDIQYTEVFDFIVTSVLVAAFQVETVINTAFTVEMPMVVTMEVYEELSEE